MGLAIAVARLFDLIFLILFVTILLSWFPNIKWHTEPFRTMRTFSEIFLSPFRKIIPPIGMVDISPIVAFFVLSLLRNIIVNSLLQIGL
ncbi:YggT family protein [bacterium]|nr:YggT family protein [bacterium]